MNTVLDDSKRTTNQIRKFVHESYSYTGRCNLHSIVLFYNLHSIMLFYNLHSIILFYNLHSIMLFYNPTVRSPSVYSTGIVASLIKTFKRSQ